jgi:hypothetical protein
LSRARPKGGSAELRSLDAELRSLDKLKHVLQNVGRWQSEIKRRSRSRRRLDPHSAAMPLDGLLAECQPKSVPGVFFAVQAFKRHEYTTLEGGLYAGTVVSNRENAIEIHPSG